ncbi:MAG: Calx-beta domain-containing protein, partial [Flavobacteriaceae bacterium]
MKQFITKIAFIVLIILPGLLKAQTSTPPSGSGTSADPYQIASLENLYWMTEQYSSQLSKHYIQTADIDASDTNNWIGKFPPIGTFLGTYDGQNFSITNLYVKHNNRSGMFRAIGGSGYTATVKNLNLIDLDVQTTYAYGYVGGLASFIVYNSIIDNVNITGSVSSSENYVGGLAAELDNSDIQILNSSFNGSVSGDSYVGGLIGKASGGDYGEDNLIIQNCYTEGTVNGASDVGGLIGQIVGGINVQSCYSNSDITASGSYSAGLIGWVQDYNSNNTTIQNSFATGDVSGNSGVAGLVYYLSDATIDDCFATGALSGNSSIYGLVNKSGGGIVTNSFWDTQTSGTSNSNGGTGKTTTELQTLSTYTNAGWDFQGEVENGNNNYWGLIPGLNSGYPYLTNNTGPDIIVSFSSDSTSNYENTSSETIVVNLSRSSQSTVTVDYSITGSASQGTDFTLNDGQLTFSPGDLSENIIIASIVDDSDIESSETVIITLSNPSSGIFLGTNQSYTYTILDNDGPPTIQFDTTSGAGLESIEDISIDFNLNFPSLSNSSVNYTLTGTSTGGGTDYSFSNGLINIDAGNTSGSLNLSGVVNDLIDEENETIIISLTSDSNAIIGNNSSFTYTITDNDGPEIEFDAIASTGEESNSSIAVQVNLNASSYQDITLPYTISGSSSGASSDHSITDGNLTINAGENSSTLTLTGIIDDSRYEDDETLIITLGTPIDGSLGSNNIHTYTIQDNDSPPEIEFNLSSESTTESSTTISVQIDLSSTSYQDASVSYSLSGGTATLGSDFTLSDGTATILAGDSSTTFDIVILEDSDSEPTETIIVSLSSPTGSSLGTQSTYTLSISNDDFISPSSTAPSNGDGSEGSPYEIASLENLYWMTQQGFNDVISKHFIQTADIDASDSEYWSGKFPQIGNNITPFSGSYNGQDYIISNLFIESSGHSVGLFHKVSSDSGTAVIKNLTLKDIDVKSNYQYGYFGSLAGQVGSNAEINNVHISGKVYSSNSGASYIGGFFGETVGDNITMNDCSFNGTIDGETEIGGLIGVIRNTDVVISNSFTKGNYSGTGSYARVGGLIGYIAFENTKISNSYSEANITVSNDDAGGLVGFGYGDGFSSKIEITNSYASGTITGEDVGGLMGNSDSDVIVTNCYFIGQVSGGPYLYGLMKTGATVNNSFYITQSASLSSGLGTEKSSTELKTLSTYTSAGWDFSGESDNGNNDHWEIDDNFNSGYPYLSANNNLGSIQFSITSSENDESNSSQDISVILSESSSSEVSVNYTLTGTATGSGTDYLLNDGTLSIPAGNTSGIISIASIVDDAIYEGDETVIITLSSATGSTLGSKTVHTYTITDNDTAPTVEFNSLTSTISEGTSTKSIQVDLSSESAIDITVNYALGSVDYNSVTVSGVTSEYQGPYTRVSQRNINSSNLWEENGYYYFVHSTDSEKILVYDVGDSGWVVESVSGEDFSISPNIGTSYTDSPGYFMTNDSSIYENNIKQPTSDVYFSYNNTSAEEGSDFSLSNGTLTILAGETSNTIEVTSIEDDEEFEGNENLKLILSDPVGATLGSNITHYNTIEDNDIAPLIEFNSSSSSNPESVNSSTVQINLSHKSYQDISVSYSVSGTATASLDGYDYEEVNISGVGASWSGPYQRETELSISNTDVWVENGYYYFTHSSDTSKVLVYDEGIDQWILLGLVGDDFTPLPVDGDSASYGSKTTYSLGNQSSIYNEEISQPTFGTYFTYSIDSESTINYQEINVNSVNSEYIGPYTRVAERNINGAVWEQNEYYYFVHNTDSDKILVHDGTQWVIREHDGEDFSSPPSIGASSIYSSTLTIGLGTGDSLYENSINQPTNEGYFSYSISPPDNGADFTLFNGKATIAAGSLSNTINIESITDDELYEGDETIVLTLSNPENSSLGSTTSHTYTIEENDPITTISIDDTTVNEGAGTATVTIQLSSPSANTVTVDYTTADNTASVADSDYDAVSTTTMTFDPGE